MDLLDKFFFKILDILSLNNFGAKISFLIKFDLLHHKSIS